MSLTLLFNKKISAISKTVIAVFLLYFIFSWSIVSPQVLLEFFKSLNFRNALTVSLLSLVIVFGLYYRWYILASFFFVNPSHNDLIKSSSEAYSLGQIIPGQLGIDAWRIIRLRGYDRSKFYGKLIGVTLIEKILALVSQLSLGTLFFLFFVEGSLIMCTLVFLLIISLGYVGLFFAKLVFGKYLEKSLEFFSLSLKNYLAVISYCIILNIISCYLVFYIDGVISSTFSFFEVALSVLLSNLAAAIPISPNGLGVSEVVYAKALAIMGSGENITGLGTSYFVFRLACLSANITIMVLARVYSGIMVKAG